VKATRNLDSTYRFDVSGETLVRTGEIGKLHGVPTFESQNLATQAVTGTADVAGAVDGALAIGATSMTVDALGTGTIAAGTTFAFTGTSGRFSVVEDATIAANAATISFWPPLKSAVLDNAVVTFIAHTTAGSANLLFHPDSIALVTRRPPPLGGGVMETFVSDPSTGLALRVAIQGQILGGAGSAYSTTISTDVVFGVRCLRPEWAVKIYGD
jgi:hypothetical protein